MSNNSQLDTVDVGVIIVVFSKPLLEVVSSTTPEGEKTGS